MKRHLSVVSVALCALLIAFWALSNVFAATCFGHDHDDEGCEVCRQIQAVQSVLADGAPAAQSVAGPVFAAAAAAAALLLALPRPSALISCKVRLNY
ncbi:MAG: hypothetical protein LBS32_06430 [Clostridiales Family XIII bacterium]|jgi:hypothetical protein|nr:hypothetical protein [Clostridiales Family XIII bacterium]